jgi:hypothetical protein
MWFGLVYASNNNDTDDASLSCSFNVKKQLLSWPIRQVRTTSPVRSGNWC